VTTVEIGELQIEASRSASAGEISEGVTLEVYASADWLANVRQRGFRR
jgi:hypothetical protein